MKVIRPLAQDTTTITSGIPGAGLPYQAWSSGTTYSALTATVAVFSGTNVAWYRNLQIGNIGHSPASSPTWWRKVADSYAEWDAATTYSLGQRVTSSVFGDRTRTYESIQAGNLNHHATDPAWWLDIGPNNRWAMFDQVIGSKTVANDEIKVSFRSLGLPGSFEVGRVDSVALLNVSATSAQIVSYDYRTATTVYDQTFSLIDGSGITDWYAYFYEDATYLRELIVLDLPPVSNPLITITLANPGGEVSIGAVIAGQQRDLGGTQYGASIGITDYSKKEADEFGGYSIVERAFSKRGRFTVMTENERVPALIDLAAQYRATPVVWVGSDAMAFTALYGFYKDFNVEIAYPTMSVCTLDIEGLT